jgi:nuclear cap-binding protein subunit 1
LIVVFETLLSSAATTVDEEKGNPSWQPQADFYVICILSSLPWGGSELAEQVPDEIERVLVGIQAYLSIRKNSSTSGLNFFHNGEFESSLAEKVCLLVFNS